MRINFRFKTGLVRKVEVKNFSCNILGKRFTYEELKDRIDDQQIDPDDFQSKTFVITHNPYNLQIELNED